MPAAIRIRLASTSPAGSSISTAAASSSTSRLRAWCASSGADGAEPPWAITSPAPLAAIRIKLTSTGPAGRPPHVP